ncbi:MAG: acetyltransferase [Gammaproteobacteria bacterium]|nr:acetyltransferase [Gammaproteobacteria bacterium]
MDKKRLAEAVRQACLRAASEGYESASISGLCHEGAMEAAFDAIRRLDLETVLQAVATVVPGKKP